MKIEEIINKNYKHFSDIDENIAKYVLDHKDTIGRMGINEVAQNSFTSKSSVLRFSQKLGFSGFSEFKNYIKREAARKMDYQEPHELFDQVITDIEKTVEYLKNVDLHSIYEALDECKDIYILSTGVAQVNQANELQRLFMMSGRSVHILPGSIYSSEYRRIIENVTEEDLIFVLSLSGENPTLDGVLDIPKVKGAKTISLTNFKSNSLAGKADFKLYASSTLNPAPQNWWTQSVSSFFVVLEALLFGYMDYRSRKDIEG
ncbi:MurR/RpiR family transcriptional regulator [Bacillus sp. S3]|uniref:MurR/RpiR family transcriptional regulator n=1 Tax=Bacillus sp. S3 TaxID=486398 RepID=UPI00118CA1AE|nr:MurR/RpiR family transcriptional regulator [Bacillus sp. S3]QCJ44679.1 MurR/RpiR family transcriptional regulator [Bacillus sp. S3]